MPIPDNAKENYSLYLILLFTLSFQILVIVFRSLHYNVNHGHAQLE